jgi:hypothetical protein
MNVCTNCHYQDSAHGAKRVYKDFCTRCHTVGSKGNLVMGPTHLDASRWAGLNLVGNGLLFLLLLAMSTLIVFKSRKRMMSRFASWQENMKMPVIPEEPGPQATQVTEKQENNENA